MAVEVRAIEPAEFETMRQTMGLVFGFDPPEGDERFSPESLTPGRKIGEMRMTEVVNRIERLPLTAENRAHLTASWVPKSK